MFAALLGARHLCMAEPTSSLCCRVQQYVNQVKHNASQVNQNKEARIAAQQGTVNVKVRTPQIWGCGSLLA